MSRKKGSKRPTAAEVASDIEAFLRAGGTIDRPAPRQDRARMQGGHPVWITDTPRMSTVCTRSRADSRRRARREQ